MNEYHDKPYHSDPETCGGTLVFKGTRVFVEQLFEYLAAGDSIDEFHRDFDQISRADLKRTVELAQEAFIGELSNEAVAQRAAQQWAQARAESETR